MAKELIFQLANVKKLLVNLPGFFSMSGDRRIFKNMTHTGGCRWNNVNVLIMNFVTEANGSISGKKIIWCTSITG